MSRVGLKPVLLPKGVTAAVKGQVVSIKGPKGELSISVSPDMAVTVREQSVVVENRGGALRKAVHGTTRALLSNMAVGVSEGYQKELEIEGVGYKAALQGQKLVLNLGFSHAIDFPVPAGIKIEVADGVKIKVSGIDKHLVGEVAARIRGFHKAEPYKGKGVKYKGEQIRRKAGKTVA